MAGLDILVSSSVSEGFSNVIGEAMACGVPCVVTDVGDSRLIVGDTGYVVPPGKPAALAEAMVAVLRLTESDRRSLGLAARRRVGANFSLEKIVQRYLTVWNDVLGCKRSLPSQPRAA